ncbi:GD15181 [Drosophila simulans]|uniref:GD15181 n=1 Tax=Drosophila simulans TaxID=7240 RepID=B4NTF6_DROSI|nr:GD15181 [Drosophila simulans]
MLRCGETDKRRLQQVSVIGTILELLLLRVALMMRLMWVVRMLLVALVVRLEILARHTRATFSRIGSRDWAVAYNIVPQQRAPWKRTGCAARRYSVTVAVGMWNLIAPMASGSDSSLAL